MREPGLTEELHFYEPSPEVQRQIGEIVLYAVVGPSGSGKDSVMDHLAENWPDRFGRVVGDASRRPRKGEVDGQTYHFRTKDEMAKDLLAQRYVQVAPGSLGNFYGTRISEYPKDKISLMAIQARVMQGLNSLGFKRLVWLQLVPKSHDDWLNWQQNHDHTAEDTSERLEEGADSYTKALLNRDAYFILNDSIDDAAARIVQVADGRRPADERDAREIAVNNMEALKKLLGQN